MKVLSRLKGPIDGHAQDTRPWYGVNRKNGTPRDAILVYREFAPAPELRGQVRSFFTLSRGGAASRDRGAFREVTFANGESFCSPLFADGHPSIVVDLGAACRMGAGWVAAPLAARVIGPMRSVGGGAGDTRPEAVGAYLNPGSMQGLLDASALSITDKVARLEDFWGSSGARLAEDLAAIDESSRVAALERVLVARARLAPRRSSIDVAKLARFIRADPARANVTALAQAAGVSRQHLTRVFRDVVGLSPKRYCRIARFQAGLAYADSAQAVEWSVAARELGYADQSHMIADFREMSGLTPAALATGRWFHPFILDAREHRVTGPPAALR
jgi:AraC-like DNA-binding protein